MGNNEVRTNKTNSSRYVLQIDYPWIRKGALLKTERTKPGPSLYLAEITQKQTSVPGSNDQGTKTKKPFLEFTEMTNGKEKAPKEKTRKTNAPRPLP